MSTGAQQAPKAAPIASARPSLPSLSRQPLPVQPAAVHVQAAAAPVRPSTAPVRPAAVQSKAPAQSAVAAGSVRPAAATAAPATAPAAAPQQPQLGPEQLAALHAIAQSPALQALATQPDRLSSEQLLVALLSQAFGQPLAQAQPAAQTQPAAQPRPAQQTQPAPQSVSTSQLQPPEQVIAQFWPNSQQGQPMAPGQPNGQPEPPRKPFRIHPAPIRKKKAATVSEQLRGRQAIFQTAPAPVAPPNAASLQPGCLPTHRTLKSPGKKTVVSRLCCNRLRCFSAFELYYPLQAQAAKVPRVSVFSEPDLSLMTMCGLL